MFSVAIAVTLLSLIVAVAYLFQKRPSAAMRSLVDKMPGPPVKAFFGNALDLKRDSTEFYFQVNGFCNNFAKDTGILRIWLGYHVLAVVSKAETAEVLLKSSTHITKSFLYSFLTPWLGTGLLTSTGEKWHSRRKLITPSFHFKILEDFLQVFNEQATVLLRRLDALLDGKQSVNFDISKYIALCTLDIICDSAMGQHINAQGNEDSEYVQAINKITELIMRRIKNPWMWPDSVYSLLPDGRLHNRLLQTLHDFTDKVIRERQEEFREAATVSKMSKTTQGDKPSAIGTRKRLAFLDMLLYSAEDSAQLTRDDIREEVDTFMFEGHDTTAVAANWAIHLIGAHPEVQAKLHLELDEIFGDSDRAVTMEDIKKLKFLECVVKESLRIFPSVPFVARKISEDANIGGYFVPKDSTGIIMISVIHKDPTYFPDPEAFLPERWSDPDSLANRHPFAYIPFSAGLRNCIGQKFAMIEEKVILSSIFRRFKVKSLQTRDQLMPVGDLILRSLDGIRICLERR